jgi:hypothetical protein
VREFADDVRDGKFYLPILAASCAAFRMVIHSEADGLERRFS